jgi:hypothetical protein
MKKNIVLILICALTQNSSAQEQIKSDIDFFEYITQSNISIGNYLINKDTKTSISYFCRGLNLAYRQKGFGIFFAIPKKEYKIWKIENKTDWERKDLVKNNQEKIDMAKSLLFSQKNTLIEYFDLYVFYVKQSDLIAESTLVTDDGKILPDYQAKDDATIYTYKYKNDIWVTVGKANIEGHNSGYFGEAVVEKILKERFGKDISIP